MKTVELSKPFVDKYSSFIERTEKTSIFYSDKYRILLKTFMRQEDHYILSVNQKEEILGVLPAFIFKNERYGNILNSMPFYGSNGGILEFAGNTEVKRELVSAFERLAKDTNCAASTIVSSLFDEGDGFYRDAAGYDYKDDRIGQVTELTRGQNMENLMGTFHHKTRNMIRKALKNNVAVSLDNSASAFRFLVDTHKENMATIGGLAKEEVFFECVRSVLKSGEDYNIYTAYLDKRPVAALLLLYFNKTVEYFTPVIKAGFKDMQPLSLLIFEAMKDAVDRGYKYWNWGGTWLTQEGLYRFKKRWSAQNRPYYYFTKIYDDKILRLSKEEVLREYPYFYVYPFDKELSHEAGSE